MIHVINLSTKGRVIFKYANLAFERRERKAFSLLNFSYISNEEEKKEDEE